VNRIINLGCFVKCLEIRELLSEWPFVKKGSAPCSELVNELSKAVTFFRAAKEPTGLENGALGVEVWSKELREERRREVLAPTYGS
jgi:hypothetical protein